MMAAAKNVPLRGTLRHNERLANHTSWRVGGPAEHWYEPADLNDLALFLSQLPAAEAVMWLGLGSNLLVRDGGVRGTVIVTRGLLGELALLKEHVVRVEAGVSCAKVARFCSRQGLVGAEFLAGIPGTMGGALAMNAGAFGGETWSHVVAVETLDRQGRHHLRSAAEYTVAYRHVTGPQGEWFSAAHLQLAAGDSAAASNRIRELLERRSATQPIGQASCGSVFRNPDGDFAARLIEVSGLKGRVVGDAVVSEKHANFIVNRGGATAADIETLIHEVMVTVKERQGVVLLPEVHVVGEAP